jgi:A/G-specific adenine glycosylase
VVPSPAERRAFRQALPRWFAARRRDLPWRTDRTPYRVWISETMLQQTQVDTVLPYFMRFLERFPTVAALAAASLGEVLKMWEGLGYYTRARNLHRAARAVMETRGGRLPDTHADWLSLPGVGPYTAAAVCSLSLGLDHAVVDGNVIRVLARVFAVPDPVDLPATRRALQTCADALLPPGRADVFNEAMMELGALVCRPRHPDCPACPLRGICRAAATGTPEHHPVKRPRAAPPLVRVGAAATRDARGRFLVAQRPERGLLGGLWEFPGGKIEPGEDAPACIRRELREELGIEVEVGPLLLVVRHAYSHFKLEMHVHLARRTRGRPRALECADFRWLKPEEMRRLPFSGADLKVLEFLTRTPPP